MPTCFLGYEYQENKCHILFSFFLLPQDASNKLIIGIMFISTQVLAMELLRHSDTRYAYTLFAFSYIQNCFRGSALFDI